MLWFVTPTYNERDNIQELVERLFALPAELHLLVVDDASPDGTAEVVERLAREYPRLHLLRRGGKCGLGSAYREGFRYALERGATAVGEIDADLSHLPEDAPRLALELASGADVVVGSRRVRGGSIAGWGPWRTFTSWAATLVSRLVLGVRAKDITAGFRLYGPGFLARVPWERATSNGYAWQEEMLFLAERAGLKVVEVPVLFADRRKGRSKLSLGDVVEFFATLLRLRISSLSIMDGTLSCLAVLLGAVSVVAIIVCNLTLTQYQSFSYLADSFLHGRLDLMVLPDSVWMDVAAYRGLMFWPHGPVPATLLMPFVAIASACGWFFRQGFLQLPLLGLLGFLLYSLGVRSGIKKAAASWLTFAFFTSHFLIVAMMPSSYHLAHVVALTAVFGALVEHMGRRRPWLMGALSGVALLSRTPAGLVIVFFMLEALRDRTAADRLRRLAQLLAPFAVAACLFAWYNVARFGNPFEQGYSYQVMVVPAMEQARSRGTLSLAHVPSNLYYMFLNPPRLMFEQGTRVPKFPFVVPDLWGMSLLLTSPYLLYLMAGRRLTHMEQNALVTTAIIAIPILMYFGIGYRQFGYRYALDFLPLLFFMLMLLFARRGGVLSRTARFIIVLSASANQYLLLSVFLA